MKIAVIIGSYLPGYHSGGPVRSLANMVECLGAEFQFLIFTSDRDFKATQPYSSIHAGRWNKVEKGQVFYLSPLQQKNPLVWRKLLRELDYDILYLNSFFSIWSIRVLLLRRFGLIRATPTIVAPRGEFSSGALSLKSFKKRLYLALAKILALYQDVFWQATSPEEAENIVTVFQLNDIERNKSVIVAPNLPRHDVHVSVQQREKSPGKLRIVFLSRISRKKNLDTALKILASVSGRIQFDIYGPLEDVAYWNECQVLIRQFPSNVQVVYRGVVSPEQVAEVLGNYHLFLLPTRGENFGHVILEALCAGCLILISDQTPWRQLESEKIGWDIPLDESGRFKAAIEQVIEMDQSVFNRYSEAAASYGWRFASNPALVEATRNLFLKVLGKNE